MIVLDTAVLIYAVGDEHPFREPSRRLLNAVHAGRLQATTTLEVVQEFLHARARRRSREDAVALARSFATSLTPLIATNEDTFERGLRLFARYPRLGAFDAVIAAAAIGVKADALVSSDRDFRDIRGLRFVELGSPQFERLLRR